MRLFEIILSFTNVLTFLVLVIPRLHTTLWMGYVAVVGLLVAILQVVCEGPRWQMIPAYVLMALFLLVWLLQQLAPVGGFIEHILSNKFIVGSGLVLGIVGLGISVAIPIVLPVFNFPEPSGPYQIGTVTYHWTDKSRSEIFVTDSTVHRELMVQVWYPTQNNTRLSYTPYLEKSSGVPAALSRLKSMPDFAFDQLKYVTTHARPAALVADGKPNFPVLIFLEGAKGFRQMNTFQVEELVSQGYIVVAIDQPYTAASVDFPGGRQVDGLPLDQMKPLIRQSYAPVDQSPVLNGQKLEKGIIPYLAQDVVFTLDQLTTLNQSDPKGILTGRLDLSRIGTFGISLGGIVAGEVCRIEPRLRACLVMDAAMPTDTVKAGLQQPAMWITRDAETMRLERRRAGGWPESEIDEHQTTMRAAFAKDVAESYFVQVPGMFHLNLTDVPYWSPISPQLGLAGPIDKHRAYRIINDYSTAFFDRHLKNKSSIMLEENINRYPEVMFETRRP